MTRGCLWFCLSLGSALMLAAVQQLVPDAPAFWLAILALGAAIILAAGGFARRKILNPYAKTDE